MGATTTRVKKRRRIPKSQHKTPGRKYEGLETVISLKITERTLERLRKKGNVSQFIRAAIAEALKNRRKLQ